MPSKMPLPSLCRVKIRAKNNGHREIGSSGGGDKNNDEKK